MRIVNRLLAFVVAAAIIVAGVIVIVEVIAVRSGAQPVIIGWHSMLRWAQRNTWNADSVELACAILVVVGLLLVLPQLRRRRPTRLSVRSSDATDAAVTRKGVAVTVRGAVQDVEGISGSRIKVNRRAIRVNATSAAGTDPTAQSSKTAVRTAAQHALDELRLTSNLRLRINVDASAKKGSS